MSSADSDHSVDVSALPPPLPVLLVWRALKTLRAGEVLRVIAASGQTMQDLTDFSKLTGHSLKVEENVNEQVTCLLQKR